MSKKDVSFVRPDSVPVHSEVRGAAVYSMVVDPTAKTTATPELFSDSDTAKEYQMWGADNLWPSKIREKIQDSTSAYPFIAKQATMIYGNGPMYYRETFEKGQRTINWERIPEIDDFMLANDIPYFLLERLMDYKTYGNMFCEYVLNTGNTGIVNVYHKEAEFTRFGKIENNSVTNVLYNSDWTNVSKATPIPFCPRRKQNKEYILKTFKKDGKFVTHSCLPSPGSTLYAKPIHYGLVKEDGWLDYANSIPKIMNAINKNGMMIRHHIRIPYSYWASVHADWSSLTKEKQTELMNEKLDAMDSFLKGTSNAGSTFISHFATDPITGKPLAGWEIEVLDDPIKKDQFLTSVQEADIQSARAFGVDLSLAGIQPAGGSLGAGSGSDKRVGFTNSVTTTAAEELFIFEPLRLIGLVNGWDPTIKWTFEHDIPTTLNENKSGVTSNLPQ